MAELVEELKKGGLGVEELPTGYIFTILNEAGKDIVLNRQQCEIIQNIGKIEQVEVKGGKQLRIVVITSVIGSG